MYTIKNYKSGTRKLIIDYYFLFGVISKKAMSLLPKDNYRTFIRKFAEMKKEGVIEEVTTANKKTITRIRDYSENKIIISEGRSEQEIMDYETGNNIYASRIKTLDSQKAHRYIAESDVKAFVYSADIVLNSADGNNIYLDSKYLKGHNDYSDDVSSADGKRKVQFSKANGVVISNGGNYVAYRLLTKRVSRLSVGEYKIRNHAMEVIKNIKPENKFNLSSGLLLADKLDYFVSALAPADFDDINSVRFNNFLNIYNEVYALPYSKEGVKMMQLMTKEDWQTKMKLYATDGKYNGKSDEGSIFDYRSGNTFILVFCVPDIVRLKHFVDTAKLSSPEREYYVACFDFQREFVEQVSQGSVTIMEAPLENYYEVHKND